MGTVLSYSGLSTKIRAMQSRLVTDEQLEEIVQLENKKANPDLEVFKLQSNRIQIWNNSGESSSLSWRKYRSRTGNYLQKCRGLSLRVG